MYKSEVVGKGGITAKVVAHSASNGSELITFQLRAPKFLDAEFEKHRMISSNSSSDRAIPLVKMLQKDYFLPQDVRINAAGMQGELQLSETEKEELYADLKELYGTTSNILTKWNKVHKQHLNRYLLGFSFQDKVATANKEWFEHFYNLRLHPAADPAMYELAKVMKQAQEKSTPITLKVGEWHLPYFEHQEFETDVGYMDMTTAIKCSVARCARVSYMKHDGSNPSVEDDLELYNMLAVRPYTDKRGTFFNADDPVHLSPLEHQATPMRHIYYSNIHRREWEEGQTHVDKKGRMWSGNFKGFIQCRQLLEL
jgi:thymidylate synthase ThyX